MSINAVFNCFFYSCKQALNMNSFWVYRGTYVLINVNLLIFEMWEILISLLKGS